MPPAIFPEWNETLERRKWLMESCVLPVPQLTTDRLPLRGFRPDDFERYAEMMADPDVCRVIFPPSQ